MKNTSASEIIDVFESSFADKCIIPYELELVWLKKAIGRFSTELTELKYDEELQEFNCKLDTYVMDTLAQMMKQFYQETLSNLDETFIVYGSTKLYSMSESFTRGFHGGGERSLEDAIRIIS